MESAANLAFMTVDAGSGRLQWRPDANCTPSSKAPMKPFGNAQIIKESK